MIFYLVEELNIPNETYRKYDDLGNRNEKIDFIQSEILPKYFKRFTGIHDLIQLSILVNGLDDNEFITFIDTLPFSINNSKYSEAFQYLYELNLKGQLSLEGKDYLTKVSLYDRDAKDFKYAVQAFEFITDPEQVEGYFKDTTGISETSFYEKDGETIKPSGRPHDDPNNDTIYNQIEKWAKDNEKKKGTNKKTDEKESQNEYSLLDVIGNINFEKVFKFIDSNYKASARYYSPKQHEDKYKLIAFLSLGLIPIVRNWNENLKRAPLMVRKSFSEPGADIPSFIEQEVKKSKNFNPDKPYVVRYLNNNEQKAGIYAFGEFIRIPIEIKGDSKNKIVELSKQHRDKFFSVPITNDKDIQAKAAAGLFKLIDKS